MQVNILPDIPNLLLTISSTIVLFLVVRHFAYQPLLKMLEARAEKVHTEMAEAKQKNEEATNLRLEYESRIQEAKDEARVIVESAKKRSDQLKSEILDEAKVEAQKISERATLETEREKQKMLDDLRSEVVDIATLAASKVLEKELDSSTHKTMIDKFITEVGDSKWVN